MRASLSLLREYSDDHDDRHHMSEGIIVVESWKSTRQEFRLDRDFSDQEADVLLVSSDNVGFRIHSWTVKTASPVFEDMFSLPKLGVDGKNPNHSPPATAYDADYPLDIDLRFDEATVVLSESSAELRLLLRLLTGSGIPCTIDEIEIILTLADKYMILGAIKTIRQILTLPGEGFIKTHPVRVYGLAYRFQGLDDIASAASREILDLDLVQMYGSDISALAREVGVEGYFRLQELRISRRTAVDTRIAQALEGSGRWMSCPGYSRGIASWSPHGCPACLLGDRRGQSTAYRQFLTELRAMLYMELDRRPSGKGLKSSKFRELSLFTREPVHFDGACAAQHGEGRILRMQILEAIQRYIDELPDCVEFTSPLSASEDKAKESVGLFRSGTY